MIRRRMVAASAAAAVLFGLALTCSPPALPEAPGTPAPPGRFAPHGELPRTYPWHTDILAATFWVGEVLDPLASDGSQRVSTYDSQWIERYGGCDGRWVGRECRTEQRYAEDGYWPRSMEPEMNPFYLDLPYDDVNDDLGFAWRGEVVPWARDPGYAPHVDDRTFSLMKNRWVEIRHGDRTCFGQIADAGPANYHDTAYVFGTDDARPATTEFRGAGMDVSPALNACLHLAGLDMLQSRVDWRFAEAGDVPDGPWARLVDDDPRVR